MTTTARERFLALVEAYRRTVYRAAFRVLGNTEDALDVMQETFLRLSEHLDAVPDQAAASWLGRVATNRALDVVRRRDPLRGAVSIDAPDVPLPEGRSAPSVDPSEVGETRARVASALAALPRRQAEVVNLRIYESLSFADLARALGISEGAAKTHFRRAIEALRPKLGWLAGAPSISHQQPSGTNPCDSENPRR